jgi:hypothetical protein
MMSVFIKDLEMADFQAIRSALNDEINTAREGVAFYTNRIAELEKIRSNLDALNGEVDHSHSELNLDTNPTRTRANRGPNKKRGRPAKQTPEVSTVAAVPAKQNKKAGKSLPATGTAFWSGLLSPTPMSNKEIITAAVSALGIKPSADDQTKLKQRLANFVTTATREGSVVSEGTGRARRFSVQAKA